MIDYIAAIKLDLMMHSLISVELYSDCMRIIAYCYHKVKYVIYIVDLKNEYVKII